MFLYYAHVFFTTDGHRFLSQIKTDIIAFGKMDCHRITEVNTNSFLCFRASVAKRNSIRPR